MTRIAKRAGLEERSCHAFRRSFADDAHARGVHDKDLQAVMGHADIATTMGVYVRSRAEGLRAVGVAVGSSFLGLTAALTPG